MKNTRKALPACENLYKLLNTRIEHPERTKVLDREIQRKFEKKRTIFVLDMSGFSRAVQRYGLIHYLAMIHRMRKIVRPAVEQHKGTVVKFEADNCFAVFANPDLALAATRDIHHDLKVANLLTDDESDVHIAVGIGHGPVLLFCDDMYGNEMNMASKLGEDVAERGEILLTDSAKRLVKRKELLERIPLTVSGVTTVAWKVKII